MKKLRLMVLILLAALDAQAQSQAVKAKDKFVIKLDNKTPNVEQGKTTEIELQVSRSKQYRDVAIQLSTSALPEGISVKFDKQTTTSDNVKMTLVSEVDIQAGKYIAILYASHGYVKKGVAFSITVLESEVEIITEGNE